MKNSPTTTISVVLRLNTLHQRDKNIMTLS